MNLSERTVPTFIPDLDELALLQYATSINSLTLSALSCSTCRRSLRDHDQLQCPGSHQPHTYTNSCTCHRCDRRCNLTILHRKADPPIAITIGPKYFTLKWDEAFSVILRVLETYPEPSFKPSLDRILERERTQPRPLTRDETILLEYAWRILKPAEHKSFTCASCGMGFGDHTGGFGQAFCPRQVKHSRKTIPAHTQALILNPECGQTFILTQSSIPPAALMYELKHLHYVYQAVPGEVYHLGRLALSEHMLAPSAGETLTRLQEHTYLKHVKRILSSRQSLTLNP